MWPLCLCVKTRINLLLEFKTWINNKVFVISPKICIDNACHICQLSNPPESFTGPTAFLMLLDIKKIFCFVSFCWRTSKRAHVNCDVDDIFKCLCSNQLTFLQMRRSTSCGRQKFRKKVMLFYSILDHNFYSLTEVMLYKRLV